jgi:hypothetical protein
MATTIKSLENSIYWQRVVLNQSKDAKQIERAKKAIETLELELKQLQHDTNR